MGRAEKLMSRPLCDGACLLRCQAASLRTHLKTAFFHLSFSVVALSPSSRFPFLHFLSHFSFSFSRRFNLLCWHQRGKKKEKRTFGCLLKLAPPHPTQKEVKCTPSTQNLWIKSTLADGRVVLISRSLPIYIYIKKTVQYSRGI